MGTTEWLGMAVDQEDKEDVQPIMRTPELSSTSTTSGDTPISLLVRRRFARP